MNISAIASNWIGRFVEHLLAADSGVDLMRADRAFRRHQSATDRLAEFMKELAGLVQAVGPTIDAIDRGNFASGFATLEIALGCLARRTPHDARYADRLVLGREQFDRALDALYAAVLRQGPTAWPRVRQQLGSLARVGSILAEAFDCELEAAGRDHPGSESESGVPPLFAPDTPSWIRLQSCIGAVREARTEVFGRFAAAGPQSAPPPVRGKLPHRNVVALRTIA